MGTSNTGKWGENLCLSRRIWANGRMGKYLKTAAAATNGDVHPSPVLHLLVVVL